jgi:DNA mismatch endonuclease, patch repair protein
MKARSTPSFLGLRAASLTASRAARGASKKANTRCELALRRALWAEGLRYRISVSDLPGKPDVVFPRHRIALFCDGDFWHGRDLKLRIARLRNGHNAPYWVEKIRTNVARDRRYTSQLKRQGWRVLRLWETDVLRDPRAAARRVAALLNAQPRLPPGSSAPRRSTR